MFLRLVLVEIVVHFANSLSVQLEATLEIDIPCGKSSPLVFMHTAYSMQTAGSVL